MNYLSSIGIVFLNKWAYIQGFPSITLTLIHFVVTWLGLKICAGLHVFEPKHVNITSVLPLALAFCGFVVFTNLSLTYNSVGFYQLAKTLTTPVIVTIQFFYYGASFTSRVLFSLVMVISGVAMVTHADMTVNFWGLVFASAGVLVTSLYQIICVFGFLLTVAARHRLDLLQWVKTKQSDLEMTAFQLLYYQAPLSAGILAIVLPFLENPFAEDGIFNREWPAEALLAAGSSAVMAFAVNLSIFLVIGKTSPITYNVLGHFKLCTVIVGGFVFFNDPINGQQALGIMLALAGVVLYTHFKTEEAKQAPASLPVRGNKL
ncbi:uncharacterized protein MONBRDRAFT_10334 [Monosiga brevicollis MX1]|uniref:Sugar phosphate transporter domain-containing protein n=1 Tax=Monosiga brevicollis TaxID=81824 RepID=A9V5X3_MONBE|nr:uncharacterized protein MONBRDRAFT_10334 [Monosiga brevicollis MX1]EDQ87123.1 predicted protein [Monosiga brevicollis MX1]|eukprot:XP_001748066.1 hypothetical protein [Monosiga brevicollis MX1]